MPPNADPYRTLGLPRGASLTDVKRAYRQLAKANHPDAAGEAALPRFLAIQAAYDEIVGPAGNGTAVEGVPGTGRRASGPRAPWDADPQRTDATHRAYGDRSRRARPAGPRPTSDSMGRSPNGSAGDSAAGSPGGSARSTGAGPARPRTTRDSKKATLGSTSYDGADAEPFEPDWGGASWYGTTSGTYWTLNPKEYADPRKHGPEYQARARRASEVTEAADSDGTGLGTASPRPATGSGGDASSAPPTHTTSSWWDATAADPADDPGVDPVAGPGSTHAPSPGWTHAPSPGRDPHGAPSTWVPTRFLEPASGGLAGRVSRAVLGWAPIALGIGWLAGEISGCARFAASCDAASAPIAWFAQVVVLALLLIVPRLAVAATIAAIATLVAAVPGALLVTSLGAAADIGSARSVLGALIVTGWSVGIATGLGRELRRLRVPRATPSDRGSGPVS